MITKSKGKGQLPSKPEGSGGDDVDKTPTSSGPLSGLGDPRIVRVSRAFGGKDRHSKVSTIRGLRDRRVRLSVSTAIQLYDLQDRLGLNQPSKAVDWLLNAAQQEIDKLPPLQFHELQHHQALVAQRDHASNKIRKDCSNIDHEGMQLTDDDNNNKIIEDEALGTAIYNQLAVPHASYYHWDHPSNRSFLSHLGILSSQLVADHPASHSLMTNSAPSQLVLCPPPMFSSYAIAPSPNDFDGRQFMSHQQILAQQNLPLNATARASFHSGSPKSRPF